MDSGILCISLGGSVISKKDGPNVQYVDKFAELIAKHSDKKLIITVGGGYTAKAYVEASRGFTSNNFLLDEIGINATRINAMLVRNAIAARTDSVFHSIPIDVEGIRRGIEVSRIVVLGGLVPGITTDAVSIIAGELAGSKTLINVSNIAYVYDRPPEEQGAKKLEKMTHEELIGLATKYDQRIARSNFIFDLVGAKLAGRSKMSIFFVDDSIGELGKLLEGKRHSGTVVESD